MGQTNINIIPNEDTKKAIENVINRSEVSKSFSSGKELMDDLNAND